MEDLLYEAHTLVSAVKTRVKQYQSLKEQLEEVKKACKRVADLDQAFQGKGADAIKDFYEAQLDVMDGWLDFIDVQIAFLQGIEGDMEEADLGEGTVVSTSFVDHEVTNKLNQSKEMVAQQKEDIQNILSNIEDLVDLKLYSTQSFEEKIEKAEKEKKETVHQVGELDQQWLHEYAVSEKNQGLVINLYRELMNATTKGGVASPMYFDEKAYHRSDIYQVKDEVDQATEAYIKAKEEQAEVRDLKQQVEEEANKPWYEKTWDGIATFTGEFTGYYDYKRTKEGIDPITGEKLSEADRVKAAAMAAAGFIPLIGWAGKAFKGGKAIYKTTKGINAASHALDTYKTAKTFDILQKTEMGLYGLASANGFGEYITGYDMFGNKLTEEQRQASFVQGLLGLGAGYITVKGADGVTKDAINLATDFKNVGKDIQTKGGQVLEDTSRALKLDRTDNLNFAGAQGITRSNEADTVQSVPKEHLMMKAEGVGGVGKGTGNTSKKVSYGEHYTKDGRKKVLKPNVEYTSKEGYNYKTDSQGRISSAEGTLKVGEGKRNKYAQKVVGRDDRLPDDEGGHLIASIFYGSGNLDNLVPMNGNLNKGEWKKLENTWANALEYGDEVKVKITPIYKGDSQRPVSFHIKYKIGDDEWEDRRFDNVPGGNVK
ncbi:T7SS effector LXG polymorphic toxin [Bacillus sp. FJAT-47783]|uniref:T7SS effector LXG polymorphic toxin n=1 Tax=Bacillus sp. FJAT-47783 TaxID=2922712 RepID=UPI001FAC132E|nr:T7SS effector LXG polymorphic toxin [Bacillus sp. FJAT-47783]